MVVAFAFRAHLYLMRERKRYLSISVSTHVYLISVCCLPLCLRAQLCAILIVLDIIFARAALLDYIVGDPLDRSLQADL